MKQSQLVEGIANRDSFATRWSIARVLHRNKAVLFNPAKREIDFAALAETAVEKGDLQSAKRWLVQAVGAEPRNPRHRYLLGIVLEALGDRGGAAQALTVALRLDERHADAARRLGELLARGRLPPRTRLDRQGLVAALGHDRIDRDLVAAAALTHIVEDGELGGILARAACEGWETTARGLVMRRTSPTLDDALLRAVLTASPIARLDVERLLMSVRRVALLELPVSRFADPVLLRFLAVLAAQAALNEYVWAEGDDEESAVDTLLGQASPGAVDHGNRSVDDHDNARRLALLALYRPVQAFAPCDTRVAGAPEAIAHVLNAQLELQRTIAERARLVRSLGTFGHETTRLVAAQYEAAPYPRWTSAHVAKQGVFLRETKARLGAARLAFTERPFEVLVAGCGTGKQAVTAALDWGTNARVTGVDISRASLAWASAMAERFGVSNLDLAHADIEEIGSFEPSFRRRFDVVECTGVLHHMAEPFAAWRKLIDCLAPGGLMLIGLYSAIARRSLARLRSEPEYPGAGTDLGSLRLYRQHLLSRPAGATGEELMRSRDIYTASGFRDYFLNVNEHWTTLGEIELFLEAEGLQFLGFSNVPFQALAAECPGESEPGSLAGWAAWEQRHPDSFAGMYQLWCARKPGR